MKKIVLIAILTTLCSMLACSKGSFTSVDAEQFAAEITMPDIQIVDVRTAEEYAEKHIPGAINIDVKEPDFEQKILVLNKRYPVAMYCRSGRRSKIAAEMAAKAGYKVTELDGGILSWQGATE